MLNKPDKPSSQTTSYRPISLLIAIMKLFEQIIKRGFEHILKTMISLASISQALGNPSQQTTIFSVSLLEQIIKRGFEHILKTMISLASISQALGNPSQQTTIFSVSLLADQGKLQSRQTCNSGLPRCGENLRQCLAQWT